MKKTKPRKTPKGIPPSAEKAQETQGDLSFSFYSDIISHRFIMNVDSRKIDAKQKRARSRLSLSFNDLEQRMPLAEFQSLQFGFPGFANAEPFPSYELPASYLSPELSSGNIIEIVIPSVPKPLPGYAQQIAVLIYDRSGSEYYHTIDTERVVPVSQELEKGPQGPAINKITELLAKPAATDFARAVADSRELSHAIRSEIAARIEPALDAHIRTMPSGTLDEKKAICDVIESTLEPLGLAVKDPNTGLPGKLKATSGNWPGVGTFFFEVYVNGKREKPSWSDTVPDLHVVDASPPLEQSTQFQDMVGPKANRRGRKRG